MEALELAHTIFGRLVAKCVHHGYVGNPSRLGIYGTCQLERKIADLVSSFLFYRKSKLLAGGERTKFGRLWTDAAL